MTNTNTTDVHHGKEQKRLQKPQRCIVVRNNPKDTEVHSGKKRHKETHLETKELKRVVLSNLTTYRDHVYHYPSWMVSQFLCNFYLLQVNKKFRKFERKYRDCIKRKGDKIGTQTCYCIST